MREEVLIRMGLDSSKVNSALTSVNQKISGELGKMARQWAGMFSGGVMIAGLKGLLDRFDDLADKAGGLEISTDFLQGMQHLARKDVVGGAEAFSRAISQLNVNLGKAKAGVEENVKVFQRWGFSMAQLSSMDTESVFFAIAERVKEIKDPATRAAISFELLGKSGKDMAGFLSQGADQIQRLVDGVDKLDAEKIKQLAEIKDTLDDVGQNLTVGAGKLVGGLAELFRMIGQQMSGGLWGSMQEEAYQRLQAANQKIAAQEDTQHAANIAYIAELQSEGDKKFAEEMKHEREKEKRVIAGAKRDMDEWKKNQKEKTRDAVNFDRLNDAMRAKRLAAGELSTARRDRSSNTLEDIAASKEGSWQIRGFRKMFVGPPGQQAAQEVQRLEAEARRAALFGNQEQADKLTNRALEMRKTIPGLSSSERDPLGLMRAKVDESQLKVNEALTKAISPSGALVVTPQD